MNAYIYYLLNVWILIKKYCIFVCPVSPLAAFDYPTLNNSKAMKQFYFFRNSLLPLLGALAVMCAGSCSQEILEVPDDVMPETRAVNFPQVGIACDPQGVGPDSEYFAMNREYTFNVLTFLQIGSRVQWTGTDITVEAIDGSNEAIDILLQSESSVRLRFTDVGVYRVHVVKWYFDRSQDPAPIMSCEATQICRVPSFTTSIDGPGSVILGGEYNFKLNFTDPDYPDPILKITESVFNDPKYTILSNDGAGNYRIRFDQPGDYTIEPGVGWDKPAESFMAEFSPSYHVKVFFRPEIQFECWEIQIGDDPKVTYTNRIYLNDNQHQYIYLPFRVYFSYKQIVISLLAQIGNLAPVSTVEGEVRRNVGDWGFVQLPDTDYHVDGIFYAGTTSLVPGTYFEITIPRDTCYLKTCLVQSGGPVVADSDKPIIIAPTD